MTFKAKTAKSAFIALLTQGIQRVKSVAHYKFLETVLDIELSDDKTFRENCDTKSLFFPIFERTEKCTFSFLLYVYVCITMMV